MKPTVLIAALAMLLAACVDNRSSIEITGRAAPSDPTTCKFAAGGENLLGPGTLDVSFGNMTYNMVVYLTNNLADPTATVPEALTSAKAWTATAARVRVNPKDYLDRFGASPALLSLAGENTTALDGQTVAPAGGQTAQFVNVLSRSLGAQIAAAAVAAGETRRIVVGITLEGLTKDGARLDSGEWFFPIDICNGCLQPASVTCPTGQVLVANNCFAFGQDTTPSCVAQ
jgi:hypothetical protein